jgi:hypothetical protein
VILVQKEYAKSLCQRRRASFRSTRIGSGGGSRRRRRRRRRREGGNRGVGQSRKELQSFAATTFKVGSEISSRRPNVASSLREERVLVPIMDTEA